MRLNALLADTRLGLRVLVGEDALERPLERVFTATLRDPRRYLTGGELVLSGMEWWLTAEESEAFVAALAEAKVAALGAGTAGWGGGAAVPEHVIAACRRHAVPLFQVPEHVSFATVSEQVILCLAAERTEHSREDTAFLDRYRRLVAAVAEGGGLETLIQTARTELGTDCWVISPTGRLIAGDTADMPAERRTSLAGHCLRAEEFPETAREGETSYSLLPASSKASHRLASWFLVLAGERHDTELAGELATLVGLERGRQDEARRAEHEAAAPLLAALRAEQPSSSEVTARLAETRISPGEPVCVLQAKLHGVVPGITPVVCAELLAVCGVHAVVAEHDGETLGLATIKPETGTGALDTVIAELKETVRLLEPALGSASLAIGAVTAPDASGLASAVSEAGHFRELAELAPGQASVVGGDDLASHRLLFAAVPERLRRGFRDRVLGPILRYDAEHNSELVHTLRIFLRNSAAWTQTSTELHVHVNTLRYRISRIAELTGRDLSAFADRVDLYLALEAGVE